MSIKSFDLYETVEQTKTVNEDLTLRDYFASAAMPKLTWMDVHASAKEAYRIADAMLKARK